MKIKDFKNINGFEFVFVFENGEERTSDIKELVAKHLNEDELQTAKLNKEWGCIEFKDGAVDIEPKTLYKYCNNHDIRGEK